MRDWLNLQIGKRIKNESRKACEAHAQRFLDDLDEIDEVLSKLAIEELKN